jgi:iron complex outermembrane receptor protein
MRVKYIHALLCGLSLALSGLIHADEAPTTRVTLHIEPQPVRAALKAFSDQTGVQVLLRVDNISVDRLMAPRINGELTVKAALDRLLRNSGLKYEFVNDRTVRISAAVDPPPTSASRPSSAISLQAAGDDPPAAEAGSQGNSSNGSTSSSGQNQTSESKLEEIIVSAQKRGEERLLDVPIPITALNAEPLVANNQLRVQDFYNTVPGLNYSPSGSQAEDNLSIRGISTGVGTNPTVGILVDDVIFSSPLNDGTGNDVPDIDPDDLVRIEVLRGPQGTLYGASSMGGLLKFVTKDPSSDAFSGHVAAGVSGVYNGAQPGYNFRASANIPISSDFAIRLSAFTRQDPGYIDNPAYNFQGVNLAHDTGGRLAALWNPSDFVSLKISALYQDFKADGSNDVQMGPEYANNGTGYQKPLGDLQQNYLRGVGGLDRNFQAYSAALKVHFTRAELTSVTGFSVNAFRDSWDFTQVFGGATIGQFGVYGTPVTDDATTRQLTQEIRLAGSITQNFDWLVGGFFQHNHTTYFENILAEGPTGALAGTWANWNYPNTYQEAAGFANLTYHFTDRFDVQFGGRESHIVVTSNTGTQVGPLETLFNDPNIVPEESTSANVFTYLVTPRLKLSPDVMVYARFASGYRPGASNGSAPPGIPLQSKPDKTENYELGLKGDFLDHRFSVDASIYYIDWKDLQAFVTDPSGFGYRTNVGGAKSEGVELSLQARPWTGFLVSTWATYDDAVLTKSFPPGSDGYGVPGTRLPYSSRWSGFIGAQQDFSLKADVTGFVGGQLSLVGDRPGLFAPDAMTPRPNYPFYAQANVRGGVNYQSWTTNLYVNNVTDRRGLIGGGLGTYPPSGFQYITPRTVGINVSRSF